MENQHFSWENPLFLWSFSMSQTVKLPEGKSKYLGHGFHSVKWPEDIFWWNMAFFVVWYPHMLMSPKMGGDTSLPPSTLPIYLASHRMPKWWLWPLLKIDRESSMEVLKFQYYSMTLQEVYLITIGSAILQLFSSWTYITCFKYSWATTIFNRSTRWFRPTW